MATLKLIPTSYYYVNTNTYAYKPENALADTTSTTTTSLHGVDGSVEASRWFQLIFGEQIPNGVIIDSVEVKIRGYSQYTVNYPMSAKINNVVFASGSFDTVDSIITLTPKEEFDIQTLAGTSGALLQIYCVKTNSYVYIKGAEINIKYHRNYNKIIYNNKKLIDITSVSVTPEKVAEGYTFHLANGMPAIGSAHVGIYVATASSSSSTNRNLSFTQLEKEPSWFLAVCTSRSARNNGANNVLYNGSSTKVRYNDSSSTATILSSTSYASFTYNAKTLTITLKTTPYFGVSNWELYYM